MSSADIPKIILPFVFVNYYHLFGVLLFVFSVLNLEPVQQFYRMMMRVMDFLPSKREAMVRKEWCLLARTEK